MKDKREQKPKYMTVPNAITSFRIVGALVILFFSIETVPFYVIYGVCGVSDALDGFIARRTNQTSAFGRKLDSVADLTFYGVMAYKMFIPLIETLKKPILIIVITLVSIRVLLYLIAGIIYKSFVSSHSVFNKATGLVVFMIPYTIPFKDFFFGYSIIGCVIAAAAVGYDVIHSIRLIKNKDPKEKQTGDGIDEH